MSEKHVPAALVSGLRFRVIGSNWGFLICPVLWEQLVSGWLYVLMRWHWNRTVIRLNFISHMKMTVENYVVLSMLCSPTSKQTLQDCVLLFQLWSLFSEALFFLSAAGSLCVTQWKLESIQSQACETLPPFLYIVMVTTQWTGGTTPNYCLVERQ